MTSLSSESLETLELNQLDVARPTVRFSTRRAYAQTFASMVANRCLGVVSGVLAARLLGPTGRGELTVIMFLPMLLISLGELELPRSLAYEVSRTEVVSPEVVSTGFWLSFALGCLQVLVLGLILPYTLPGDKQHLLSASMWFMPYLPAMYVAIALTGIDQGRGRFGRFSIFQVLPGAVYVLAVLVIWFRGMPFLRPQEQRGGEVLRRHCFGTRHRD